MAIDTSLVYWHQAGNYIYMIYPMSGGTYMAYRRNLITNDKCEPIKICYACTYTFQQCIIAFEKITCNDKQCDLHGYNRCKSDTNSNMDNKRLSILSNSISEYYKKVWKRSIFTIVPIIKNNLPTSNKIQFVYIKNIKKPLDKLLLQNINPQCDIYALLSDSDFSSRALASYTGFANINNGAITALIQILREFEKDVSKNTNILSESYNDPMTNTTKHIKTQKQSTSGDHIVRNLFGFMSGGHP